MRRLIGMAAFALVALTAARTRADTFAAGTLIIPMDTTYQDQGTLRAFGLLYELLRQGVPVRWVIRQGKTHLGSDFTATGVDLQTNAAVNAHAYRGGPFVIDSTDAPGALAIIQAFQLANPSVKVHKTTAEFSGDVSRYLVAAPRTAMHADGNEGIAKSYLSAGGIPDSLGDYTWAASSPDLLTPAEVAGPTTTSHGDGQLFDSKGNPAYCQFMSMHWGVNQAVASPETVAEVRQYLKYNTHLFAECQAVNAFENLVPHGFFVTTQGFVSANQPNSYDFFNDDQPFAQLDGAFLSVGGSEPSYSLAAGSAYKAAGIVMIKAQGSTQGVRDVWMTGFLDGACPPNVESCLGGYGKVSYLGGHQYPVKLPISANPSTNGTRLFLNSLFEAPCITAGGAPNVTVAKSAPSATVVDTVTFTLDYSNTGMTTAYDVSIDDPLPSGSTFVSCAGGCTILAGVVKWTIGSLAPGQGGSVSFTAKLSGFGNYLNTASVKFKVGVTPKTKVSNTTTTVYDKDSDGDGVPDAIDICPNVYNPKQDLQTDVLACGSCGNACSAANSTAGCEGGNCFIFGCNAGFVDCNGSYADGCEYPSAGFASDPDNCGSCGNKCSYPNAAGVCTGGSCSMGPCNSGWADCNAVAADGCEYAITGFQTDSNHCGSCTTQCVAGFVCTGGSCVVNQCPQGLSDCNGLPGDGCEYANSGFSTDPDNCGSCGNKCAPADATGQCVSGACVLVSCNSGFSDCNGQPADGCEYANTGFQTDPNNCGACGSKCAPANATGQCASGSCTIATCNAGHSDCNGLVSDGCEYTNSGFPTDPNNCGGCGNKCTPANATPACSAGLCAIAACLPGYYDLDSSPGNGCEYACTPKGTSDATCDGADDDCNGKIDDGYVPSTCGIGACAASSVCVNGTATCTPGTAATEGPAGDSTCSDSADNDCDGLADGSDPSCVAADAGSDAADDAGGGGAAGADSGSGGSAAADAASDGAAGSGGAGGGAVDAALGGAAGGGGVAGSAGAAGSTSGGAGGASGSAGAGATGGGATGTGATGTGATGTGATGSGAGPSKDGGADAAAGGSQSADDSGDEGGCGCRMAPSSGAGRALFLLCGLGILCARRGRGRLPKCGAHGTRLRART